jgi:hypothetical protein
VTMGAGEPKALLFVASMIAGMLLFKFLDRRRKTQATDGSII